MAVFAIADQVYPAALGSWDFTAAGFGAPQAAIFVMSGGTTARDGSPRAGAMLSVCATDFNVVWNLACVSEDGNGSTADANVLGGANLAIALRGGPPAVDAWATLIGTIVDGVRLDVGNDSGSAWPISVVLIRDLGGVAAGFLTQVAGTTPYPQGFDPHTVLIANNSGSVSVSSSPPTLSTATAWLELALIGAGFNGLVGCDEGNGQAAGAPELNLRDDRAYVLAAVTSATGALVAGGFELTRVLGIGDDRDSAYLALNWGGSLSFHGLIQIAAGTGPQAFSFGFRPAFVLAVQCLANTLSTDGATIAGAAAGSMGVGIATGTVQRSFAATIENAAGTTNTASYAAQTFVNLPQDDQSVGQVATIAMTNDGFVLDFSANSGPSRYLVLAVGDLAAGGGARRRRVAYRSRRSRRRHLLVT